MYSTEAKKPDQTLIVSQRPGLFISIACLPGWLMMIWAGLGTMNIIPGFYRSCTCSDGSVITRSPTLGNYLFGGVVLLIGFIGLKMLIFMQWSRTLTVERSGSFTLVVKYLGRSLNFVGTGKDIDHIAIVEHDTGEGMTYALRLHLQNGHKFDLKHGGSLEKIQTESNAIGLWLNLEVTPAATDEKNVDQTYSALKMWMSGKDGEVLEPRRCTQ